MHITVYKRVNNSYVVVSNNETWHNKYKPLVPVATYKERDIDRIVKKYMLCYGVDSVIGGSYKAGTSKEEKKKLEVELGIIHHSCKRCGRQTHNFQSCFETKDTMGRPLCDVWTCKRCHSMFISYHLFINHEISCDC